MPSQPPIFTPEQYQQILNLLSQEKNPGLVNFAGSTHSSLNCVETSSWLLDSGATDHFSNQKSSLQDLHPIPNKPIYLEDETIRNINEGAYSFSDQLKISKVLFALDFQCNLVSISKLTREHNCSIFFFS